MPNWKFSFFLSFRWRLMAMILLIVIPAFCITAYLNVRQRQTEETSLRQGVMAIAELAAANQENFIKNTHQLLATLTQFPVLLLSSNRLFSEQHLSNLRLLSPDYANFGLVETNGILFASADGTNAGTYLGDRSYFQRAMRAKQFSVGDFQVGRLTGLETLSFAQPVFDEQGDARRIMFASLKLDRLSEALAEVKLPEGASVTVVDRDGNILAHQPDPQNWVGKSLAGSPAFSRILSSPASDFEIQGPRGSSLLYTVWPVGHEKSSGLLVVAEVPLTILFAKSNEALLRQAELLSAVGLIIWFMVQAYARHFFLNPITALSKAATAFAAGDLGARAGDLRAPVELAHLGAVFDMAAAGVQARTADLLKNNQMLQDQISERERAQQQLREQEQEKQRLEEQFLRSQRMESLGALAGGIAHDLNNALVPVLMGSELLREVGDTPGEREQLVDLISTSGKRCTEMVKQIVSFAKGSKGNSGSVPFYHLISEMGKMANETFSKSIHVEVSAPKDLPAVEGDATELHQVLMNLCVNARDAMPEGGRLRISAECVQIDPEKPGKHPANLAPGSYVVLAVADTGTGIPPQIRDRIFDAFFTTKAPGQGTGLGLSTVASIVKKRKGSIEVVSEPGRGTEFRIYLPASAPVHLAQDEPARPPIPAGRGELILLADDEKVVVELAKSTLENYGYHVLTAANGIEAIACFEKHKSDLRLVIMDNDMPFMDGMTAARSIRRMAPDLPVILASATRHDTATLSRADLAPPAVTRLIKPYGSEQLLREVAAAIAQSYAPALG